MINDYNKLTIPSSTTGVWETRIESNDIKVNIDPNINERLFIGVAELVNTILSHKYENLTHETILKIYTNEINRTVPQLDEMVPFILTIEGNIINIGWKNKKESSERGN